MIRWLEISANRRALAYILFTVVMLGAMFVLGIFPLQEKIAEAEQKTAQLKAQIEKQRIFQPIYRRLQEEITDEKLPDRISDPFPQKPENPLTIGNVSRVLSGMAASAGMGEASFFPAPASMTRGSDTLLVAGRLEGEYKNFREFLTALVTASDFGELEMLTVQSGHRHPSYQLQIRAKVE